MRLQRYLDCARLNGRVIRLLALNRWVQPRHVARSYDRLAPDDDQAWLLHLQDTTRRLLWLLAALLADPAWTKKRRALHFPPLPPGGNSLPPNQPLPVKGSP